jgi:hypothetical protein
MKMYGQDVGKLHALLGLVVAGDRWAASHSGLFTSRKLLHMRLGAGLAPQAVCTHLLGSESLRPSCSLVTALPSAIRITRLPLLVVVTSASCH